MPFYQVGRTLFELHNHTLCDSIAFQQILLALAHANPAKGAEAKSKDLIHHCLEVGRISTNINKWEGEFTWIPACFRPQTHRPPPFGTAAERSFRNPRIWCLSQSASEWQPIVVSDFGAPVPWILADRSASFRSPPQRRAALDSSPQSRDCAAMSDRRPVRRGFPFLRPALPTDRRCFPNSQSTSSASRPLVPWFWRWLLEFRWFFLWPSLDLVAYRGQLRWPPRSLQCICRFRRLWAARRSFRRGPKKDRQRRPFGRCSGSSGCSWGSLKWFRGQCLAGQCSNSCRPSFVRTLCSPLRTSSRRVPSMRSCGWRCRWKSLSEGPLDCWERGLTDGLNSGPESGFPSFHSGTSLSAGIGPSFGRCSRCPRKWWVPTETKRLPCPGYSLSSPGWRRRLSPLWGTTQSGTPLFQTQSVGTDTCKYVRVSAVLTKTLCPAVCAEKQENNGAHFLLRVFLPKGSIADCARDSAAPNCQTQATEAKAIEAVPPLALPTALLFP